MVCWQGDIVSCAGTYIHVWSINGSPIVSVNTFTGRSQQILCCCVSEMNEWDTQNVMVTGHSDGVVRVSALSSEATPLPSPALTAGFLSYTGVVSMSTVPLNLSLTPSDFGTKIIKPLLPINFSPRAGRKLVPELWYLSVLPLQTIFIGISPPCPPQFWRMEFLQVPETPAPEPLEPSEVSDCCGEDKIGMSTWCPA